MSWFASHRHFGIVDLPAMLGMIATLFLASGANARSPVPAKSEAQLDAAVAQAMQNERDLAAIPKPIAICPLSETGEIVVCARHHADPNRYRVPSSTDQDPTSPEALDTGALHPPDVYTHPPGGVRIGVGHVPPPIYYIDTTKLPMPPPGSDADKIARGEMAAP